MPSDETLATDESPAACSRRGLVRLCVASSQVAGWMFWFRWNTLAGSYVALVAAKRS
jgi:hypothetical protein